jgi:hypothetical protein
MTTSSPDSATALSSFRGIFSARHWMLEWSGGLNPFTYLERALVNPSSCR